MRKTADVMGGVKTWEGNSKSEAANWKTVRGPQAKQKCGDKQSEIMSTCRSRHARNNIGQQLDAVQKKDEGKKK